MTFGQCEEALFDMITLPLSKTPRFGLHFAAGSGMHAAPFSRLIPAALMLLMACDAGDASGAAAGELTPGPRTGRQTENEDSGTDHGEDSGSYGDSDGGGISACPPGASPIRAGAACPARTHCFEVSESLRCQRRNYTPDECIAAGGHTIADPGDGSVVQGGCPWGRTALGFIDAYLDEGGLCCQLTAADCAGQAVELIGTCDSGPPYYSVLGHCVSGQACECKGPDCNAGFNSIEDCEVHFAGCVGLERRFCGGLGGGACQDDEYCAYQPLLLCGALDANSVCAARPDSCDDQYDPVCGCDGKTYSNACAANRDGQGIAGYGPRPD